MLRGNVRRAAASLVGAALAGVLVTGCGQDSGAKASEGDDAQPEVFVDSGHLPERLDSDGTTIVVGTARARTVVHLYEDMRCPVCEQFEEEGGGDGLRGMTLSGEVRTEYTLASFLDDRLGGKGSKKAANALRAALEEGKFLEYHDVLFAHQPEEAVDGYTDAFLLRMASKVHGLRSAKFDAAVKGTKYRGFVTASEKAFEKDEVPGTPNLAVNGKLLDEEMWSAIFDKKTLPMAIRFAASQNGSGEG
ncbi:DsbA family protein [Streptomyces sp. NPDC008313]|uniref:DsbA family protein n=1 Tax=Streptomyces sp. NPDC008313 TaxID=3364826 RepID=UPI0036E0EC35